MICALVHEWATRDAGPKLWGITLCARGLGPKSGTLFVRRKNMLCICGNTLMYVFVISCLPIRISVVNTSKHRKVYFFTFPQLGKVTVTTGKRKIVHLTPCSPFGNVALLLAASTKMVHFTPCSPFRDMALLLDQRKKRSPSHLALHSAMWPCC